MSVRLTLRGSPAEHDRKSWLLKVDEAATVGEVAESLDVSPQSLARDAEPETRLAEAGLLSGSAIPPVSQRGDVLWVGDVRGEPVPL